MSDMAMFRQQSPLQSVPVCRGYTPDSDENHFAMLRTEEMGVDWVPFF